MQGCLSDRPSSTHQHDWHCGLLEHAPFAVGLLGATEWVEVVPEATFNAWVASKGGTPKGAKPSTEATGANAAAAPVAAPATAGTPQADKAAVAQPALSQAATAQN